MTRALERVAAQTTRNIAEAASVDTGRLRRSFKYRLDAQDTVALLYVLEDASYWRFLEHGTLYIPKDSFIRPQSRTLKEAASDGAIYMSARPIGRT